MDKIKTVKDKLRSFMRARILDTLGAFASPAPGIHILNGHRVQQEEEPQTFDKLLYELSKRADLINIEDAISMIVHHENPSRTKIAFTFDDGFKECYDYFAPTLEKYGINGLFFINPNYVDGDDKYINNFNENTILTPNKTPMRWTHLEELAKRGHIIGAHTMDHYMINSNDINQLQYQITACKDVIESHIGKSCNHFAFPYGKLTQANETSIDIACNTYKYVFSQSDYKNYFSFDGKVINRRHFEPFWPLRHITYFLSCNKKY
ncbi:polysaccharide deacetylase family protein [Prevotella sp. KH2C16]|uniref:polysaccharide deacetylase family protein n=1 Tax=Prevotella sp. KH2C16 TaxID=1855325 RepID=UPI0008EA22DD|nr:polysaccharide deacetylase family protein [Prevotella sp. KH2C16]SFG62132.1 Polysaccharide deacetylase [Prevotella sp. KH2C16]